MVQADCADLGQRVSVESKLVYLYRACDICVRSEPDEMEEAELG